MDCRRAWNLMMKYFDQKKTQHDMDELNKHLNVCYSCKTKFETLKHYFAEIDSLNISVPSDIEEKVMARLPETKPKRDLLLPYVAANLIVFIGTVAYWIYQLFETGITVFIEETFSGAMARYRASTMVLTAYENFFSNYIIKGTISILIIAGLIYGTLSLVSALKKMRMSRVSES